MIQGEQKDLVVLLADLDAENAIKEILQRHHSLRVRPFSFDAIRYFGRDAGVRSDCTEVLRTYQDLYEYALVIFDHEGSGKENVASNELEREIEDNLQINGWGDRAAVIVLDPELEIWIWTDSVHVASTLGWLGQKQLRQYLFENNWLEENESKPGRPKEAMEDALRQARKPRSARYFSDLAKLVSLQRCQDPAFNKLIHTLQKWFPME